MSVRGYIGITDATWYQHLASRPAITEINFWQPSGGRTFKVLDDGEPFLFKSHLQTQSAAVPGNRILGGAFFKGFAALTVSEAWDYFGEGNGAGSRSEMLERIKRYRRGALHEDDPVIGCVVLGDPIWLSPDQALTPPADFAKNIVQGKSYSLDEASSVLDLFLQVAAGTAGTDIGAHPDTSDAPWHYDGQTHGAPALVRPRMGQGAFQARVMAA